MEISGLIRTTLIKPLEGKSLERQWLPLTPGGQNGGGSSELGVCRGLVLHSFVL